MKILILGAKGMLGTDLAEVFKHYKPYLWDSNKLNITNKKQVYKKISQIKPNIVINAAAYTNVDGCETDKNNCIKVNSKAPGYIAKACKACSSVLIHYSTDYIFSGRKKEGYKEKDKINPINIYGKSKAEGEKEIQKYTDKYYIIRTSWLFGPSKTNPRAKNFVKTMLQLSKNNDKLTVVNDQFGRPTYTKDLAQKTKEIIESKKPFGIYHITNQGTTTWYKFAKKIFELAKIKIKIEPTTSKKFIRPAKRPKYSVLINTKLTKTRNWQIALKEYINTLKFKKIKT